jgi:hypothetical protein
MMSLEAIVAVGALALAGLWLASVALLKGWQGWLELKRLELGQGQEPRPPARGRIEIADLRERVRKLETIASGIDL